MFVERLVSYSALFTILVGWHASTADLPSSDVIFARLACPLNDVIFVYIRMSQPISPQTNTLAYYIRSTMFAERLVSYSTLFTTLVGWHVSTVGLPSSDIIFARLACPLNDIIFGLYQEQTTYLFTIKHS
jgi:hypothetical protein